MGDDKDILGRLGSDFVIFGGSSEVIEPSKSSFNDPSFCNWGRTLFIFIRLFWTRSFIIFAQIPFFLAR